MFVGTTLYVSLGETEGRQVLAWSLFVVFLFVRLPSPSRTISIELSAFSTSAMPGKGSRASVAGMES